MCRPKKEKTGTVPDTCQFFTLYAPTLCLRFSLIILEASIVVVVRIVILAKTSITLIAVFMFIALSFFLIYKGTKRNETEQSGVEGIMTGRNDE